MRGRSPKKKFPTGVQISHRRVGRIFASAVISAGTGSPPPKSTRSRDPFFVVSGKGVKPAVANSTTGLFASAQFLISHRTNHPGLSIPEKEQRLIYAKEAAGRSYAAEA
jgi:hypothetical protein